MSIFENVSTEFHNPSDYNTPVARVVRDYNQPQQHSASLRWWREISKSIERSAASSVSIYPLLYLRLTVSEELCATTQETRARATDKEDNERWSREHVLKQDLKECIPQMKRIL